MFATTWGRECEEWRKIPIKFVKARPITGRICIEEGFVFEGLSQQSRRFDQ